MEDLGPIVFFFSVDNDPASVSLQYVFILPRSFSEEIGPKNIAHKCRTVPRGVKEKARTVMKNLKGYVIIFDGTIIFLLYVVSHG